MMDLDKVKIEIPWRAFTIADDAYEKHLHKDASAQLQDLIFLEKKYIVLRREHADYILDLAKGESAP